MIMRDDFSLKQAADIILRSEHLIALTGAGISKESNIPTFRGADGLWKQYDAMQLATPSAFRSNPQLVWEWYSWRQDLIFKCNPNPAHKTLASWERKGLLKRIITQNVDGLHRRAGSVALLEVHGNLWTLKCTSCDFTGQLTSPARGVPICPLCGNNLRPDVVWFGETLNREIMLDVYSELEKADVCIVIGTSALVQPAASFPVSVRQHGGLIIEVNIEATPLSPIAEVHLRGKAGDILTQLSTFIS